MGPRVQGPGAKQNYLVPPGSSFKVRLVPGLWKRQSYTPFMCAIVERKSCTLSCVLFMVCMYIDFIMKLPGYCYSFYGEKMLFSPLQYCIIHHSAFLHVFSSILMCFSPSIAGSWPVRLHRKAPVPLGQCGGGIASASSEETHDPHWPANLWPLETPHVPQVSVEWDAGIHFSLKKSCFYTFYLWILILCAKNG